MALAIIQARMGSTRFPGKVLADLCGKPVLKHVIDQVRKTKRVTEMVVATCYTKGGGAIAGRCEDWGVRCHIDDNVRDVLTRVYAATVPGPRAHCGPTSHVYYIPANIVRVCGDSPLVVPELIDKLIESIDGYDYVGYKVPVSPKSTKHEAAVLHATGYVAEVFTYEALQRANRETLIDNPDREHVTATMYNYPERFKCRWLTLPKKYRDAPSAAIDTPEDLERVAEILNEKG